MLDQHLNMLTDEGFIITENRGDDRHILRYYRKVKEGVTILIDDIIHVDSLCAGHASQRFM